MKKRRNNRCSLMVLTSLVILALSACSQTQEQHNSNPWVINFTQGTFPTTVTNFSSANSEFDDFNLAAPPTIYMNFPLSFSSNRATQGGTFDFVGMSVWMVFNQDDGSFSTSGSLQTSEMAYLNTPANELGPNIINLPDGRKIYLYASDQSGNFDIYYTDPSTGQPHPATMLNSSSDDAYPTLGPDNSIYFTSNRGGDFDIYRAEIPLGLDIATWLMTATTATITRVDVLNSTSNDKCHSINGKVIIFTATTTVGDNLLIITNYNVTWLIYINFGTSINSASDEYRPVVVYAPDLQMTLCSFHRIGLGDTEGLIYITSAYRN